MTAGIILGIYTFLTLCLIAFLVINEWNKFKNLRPGDSCGRLVEFDSTSEIIMDDIIKVDVDEKGYTIKNDKGEELFFEKDKVALCSPVIEF